MISAFSNARSLHVIFLSEITTLKSTGANQAFYDSSTESISRRTDAATRGRQTQGNDCSQEYNCCFQKKRQSKLLIIWVMVSQLLVLQCRPSQVRVNGELSINVVLFTDAVPRKQLMVATGQGMLRVIQQKAIPSVACQGIECDICPKGKYINNQSINLVIAQPSHWAQSMDSTQSLGLVIGIDLVKHHQYILTYSYRTNSCQEWWKDVLCTVCGNNRRSDRFPKVLDKKICSSCLDGKSVKGVVKSMTKALTLTESTVGKLPKKAKLTQSMLGIDVDDTSNMTSKRLHPDEESLIYKCGNEFIMPETPQRKNTGVYLQQYQSTVEDEDKLDRYFGDTGDAIMREESSETTNTNVSQTVQAVNEPGASITIVKGGTVTVYVAYTDNEIVRQLRELESNKKSTLMNVLIFQEICHMFTQEYILNYISVNSHLKLIRKLIPLKDIQYKHLLCSIFPLYLRYTIPSLFSTVNIYIDYNNLQGLIFEFQLHLDFFFVGAPSVFFGLFIIFVWIQELCISFYLVLVSHFLLQPLGTDVTDFLCSCPKGTYWPLKFNLGYFETIKYSDIGSFVYHFRVVCVFASVCLASCTWIFVLGLLSLPRPPQIKYSQLCL
eukprot:403338239